MTIEEAQEAYLDVIDEILDLNRPVTEQARKVGREEARKTLLLKPIQWDKIAAEFTVEEFKAAVRTQWQGTLS
jgi:hypothetical protein